MRQIADSTVRRLSLYLRFLEESRTRHIPTVSSEDLAQLAGTTSAQVRKDLSFFGSFGTRGLGYDVSELIGAVRSILGLEHPWRIIIVGTGKIGSALAQYEAFRERGFHVIALYDNDPSKIGLTVDRQQVRDVAAIAGDARLARPDIAVITVPAPYAQATAELVVQAGIRGILNFAPAQLRVPAGVTVQNVNMATELEVLSYALAHRA